MEKKPFVLVEPYNDLELRRLESAFQSSLSYAPNAAGDFLRERDLVIMKIAAYAGLRESEVLLLQWSRIDWVRNKIYVHPYSNKERTAEPANLNKKAKKILSEWKQIFNKYLKGDFVFPSLFTFEPITTSAYMKRFREISKEAKIYRKVWITKNGQTLSNKRFNSLRKYFATKLNEACGNPYIVLRSLRHRTFRSIHTYVQPSDKLIISAQNNAF